MRYSPEEKDVALSILDEQAGDFKQASVKSGIPVESLRRWAKQRQIQQTENALAALDHNLEILRERASGQDDDAEEIPLVVIRKQMLSSAFTLAISLRAGLEETPLNHRANALNQLVDKILRMAELLPENSEQVIRIEYLDPDGSIHSTPYWARENSEA